MRTFIMCLVLCVSLPAVGYTQAKDCWCPCKETSSIDRQEDGLLKQAKREIKQKLSQPKNDTELIKVIIPILNAYSIWYIVKPQTQTLEIKSNKGKESQTTSKSPQKKGQDFKTGWQKDLGLCPCDCPT